VTAFNRTRFALLHEKHLPWGESLSCAQIQHESRRHMNLKDLIEKRNKAMTDAAAVINKENVTTEDRSTFDRMIADADVMSSDITRMQAVDKFNAEQRSSTRPPRDGFGNDDKSEETVKNQKRAFTQWMRTGQVSAENRQFIRTQEQRDLGVGAISGPITGGNLLVPTGFDPTFHSALKSYGQLVDAVYTLNTGGGGPIDVATENDTANGLTLISEATAVTELDPTVAGFQSLTDTATSGLVSISNQLLQDSQFDLDSWIQNKLAARYYRGFANWISLGNGSNVAALGSTLGITTGTPTGVTYTELAELYGSLDSAYLPNASFVMSSATRAFLMGIVATTGQPILQPDANGTPFNAIFGRPIVIDENRPALAGTNKAILFGDLKAGYTARKAGDFGIKRLSELLALKNETGFVLFCRVGGYNTDAGTHPLRALVQHA
jgi:HK97 family phage major capsid protein